MKMTRTALEFKREDLMDVACDVHKEQLHFVARLPGLELEDDCRNETRGVAQAGRDRGR